MAFPARSLPLLLGLALSGPVLLARPGDAVEIRNPQPASAPAAPTSDATAPSVQVSDGPASDPVAADALRLDPSAGEAATDKPLPAAASAYASTESD
ncbi:hypothetical protein MZTS_18190, partial [Methylorubrum zatmanii]|nr:hypothetical protein [Methylorubrum zatmanii]